MPRNVYFSQGNTAEKRLHEDLTIEALKIYGHDVFYIPRTIVNTNAVFNEDALSKFGSAYQVEMYVENTDGFEGDGQLLSKFGVEVRDQVNLIMAQRRWEQLVGRFQTPVETRPQEGDLIYFPLVQGLFELKYVEDDNPFYQLNNLPYFRLTCELFEYGDEAIDTGIAAVDDFEQRYAAQTKLTLGSGTGTYQVGEDVTQTNSTGNIVVTGEVASIDTNSINITSQESNRPTAKVNGAVSASANVALDNNSGTLIAGMTVIGTGIPDGITIKTVTSQSAIVLSSVLNIEDNLDLTFIHDGSNSLFKVTAGTVGNIIGSTSTASYPITAIGSFNEISNNDPYADNEDFEIIGNNFIDFTETNPFGSPNVTS